MEKIAKHTHVAVRSGHKVGKSHLDAGIALWWVCTRPQARVVFSATAGHQVENILWPELRRLYESAKQRGTPLGGRLYDDYHKGLKFPGGREIFGLTTRDAEAFAGISSPDLLFIVDEASGFPEPIFDAVFGNLAGGGRVLLTGNPTRTSGTYFDAFHSKRDVWATVHIDSRETPNFRGQSVPGLATPAWLEWARRQWGEGSAAWDVRVAGQFPRGGNATVVTLADVEDAVRRGTETPGEGDLECGLDVARFGDDTSQLCGRRSKRVLPIVPLRPGDGPDTAGQAAEQALAWAKELGVTTKPRIKVDVIGVGASAYDALARRDDVEAIPVNVAESATDEEHFGGLRSQLWFGVRDFLREGGALPEDASLEGELLAPGYSFDARGRYVVESKDSVKKRLKRSPDKADALCLSVYSPPVRSETFFRGGKRR